MNTNICICKYLICAGKPGHGRIQARDDDQWVRHLHTTLIVLNFYTRDLQARPRHVTSQVT
jgi:hypothetical protein